VYRELSRKGRCERVEWHSRSGGSGGGGHVTQMVAVANRTYIVRDECVYQSAVQSP
jgi:hypothetical protein